MERLAVRKYGTLFMKYSDCEYRSPCFGCESINRCNPEKMACSSYKALKKLAEYEELEEQGKLLKLPCAVGDTVYYRYDGIKIAPMYVEKIIIAKYGVNLLLSYCGNDEELKYWTIDIESTAIDCGIVFLTREEAESALKDREIKLKDRIEL